MSNKIINKMKDNKKFLAFILFYIIYIATTELILGVGDNDIWDDREKWINKI